MRWKKGKRFKKALESSGGETGETQRWRRMKGGMGQREDKTNINRKDKSQTWGDSHRDG